jgi:hypothetical protein
LRTRSTALNRAREIAGYANHDAGLAILGNADERDHARPELLLAFVGKASSGL